MLLLFFLTLLLSRENGKALPLPLQMQTLDMQAADSKPDDRTMINIIWGCASTTFICTWTSVHPNVPPPTTDESGWKSLLRRLRLMFWALVVPELVLAWSAKQWYTAGRIADGYNSKKGLKTPGTWETIRTLVKNGVRGKEDDETQAWTRTHGHLVAMGGIILIETDGKRGPILTIEILEDLMKEPGSEINISEKEIEDKAKGDFLSKAILIFQTTWFMTQCVARFVQKIGITELEVVTLALASLNATMSFFWWSKPLGLRVPIKVDLRRKLDRRIDGEENNLDKLLSVFAKKYALQVFNIFWHSQGEPWFIRWFFMLQGYALMLFFLLVPLPIISIAVSLYGVMASNSIPSGATHVPTFYSPEPDSEVVVFRIIFPILGAVFGGIHCLGWTLMFPTETEKKIWKLGSITITIIPVLYFWITFSSKLTTGDGLPGPIKVALQIVARLVAIISVALSWVYLAARIALLVEAIELLRKQPTSVFLEVNWTRFVPHIKI